MRNCLCLCSVRSVTSLMARCLALVLVLAGATAVQAYEQVAGFTSGPALPGRAGLIKYTDGNFYGVTASGGAYDFGAIYRVTPAGVGSLVYSFSETNDAPTSPTGTLVDDGAGYLWGTTFDGGTSGKGTIFKFHVATGVLTRVVSFTGTAGAAKGAEPQAGLVRDGSGVFWGVTTKGGASDNGTVFKVTSAGVLSTVIEFTGATGAFLGTLPYSALTLDGAGFVWGTTLTGGTAGNGTVFKVEMSSGSFASLVSFTGTTGASKGATPYTAFARHGDFFWGATGTGGATNAGTVFKIDVTTHAFTTVKEFTGSVGAVLGSQPRGDLFRTTDGQIWGTTYQGGSAGRGTLFQVDPVSGNLTTHVQFNLDDAEGLGGAPFSGLISDGAGSLWGTTQMSTGGFGSVYKFDLTTHLVTMMTKLPHFNSPNRGLAPVAGLTADNQGLLWGTTDAGGLGSGTVFKFDPVTRAITTVVSFSGNTGTTPGANPRATLWFDGTQYMWGTTLFGGTMGSGTIYKVDVTNGAFTNVIQFTNTSGANKGRQPFGKLTPDGDGFLWGTTSQGGANSIGTVYKVNISSGVLTTLVEFTGNGAQNKSVLPVGDLVLVGSDLWGVTQGSATYRHGTIFKVSKTTGTLTTVLTFTGPSGAAKGNQPTGGLIYDGAGFVWGTTLSQDYLPATVGFGTVFKVNVASGALTSVLSFTGNGATNKGSGPQAALMRDAGGNIWGTTTYGGTDGRGTVFRINPATGVLTTVASLTGAVGSAPGEAPFYGALMIHDNAVWGTTKDGGVDALGNPAGGGAIFRIALAGQPSVVTQPATGITATGATLNATVSPNGIASTAKFEYGPTTAYGMSKTVALSPANGSTAKAVKAAITGLTPGTEYHFRISATNSGGTALGEDQTFTSALKPAVPAPASQLVAVGAMVEFSVAATGIPAPELQWLKNGKVINGATMSAFDLPSATLADAGAYAVKATNSAGTATSSASTLGVVDTADTFAGVNLNATLTLNAPAAGTGLTYQWLKNGAPMSNSPDRRISGVTSSKLVIARFTALDVDLYSCRVGLAALPSVDSGEIHALLRSVPQIDAVAPASLPTWYVAGTVTHTITSLITVLNNVPPNAPTKYAVSPLPPGVAFNTTTGQFSGRPTKAGDFKMKVTASNLAGSSVTKEVTVSVVPLPAQTVGVFNGLVDRDGPLNLGFGGTINVTADVVGGFSGRLTLGTRSFPLKGKMENPGNASPHAIHPLPRAGLTPLSLTFTLDMTTGELTGTVVDTAGGSPAAVTGHRNPWKTTGTVVSPPNPATAFEGYYTSALPFKAGQVPDPQGNASYPQGMGHALLTVTKAGAVSWSVKLADGLAFTHSTTLGAQGQAPLHKMLYLNTGSVQGEALLVPGTAGALPPYSDALANGELTWMKTVQPDKIRTYRKGIPLHTLSIIGGRWLKPAAGQMLPGFTSVAAGQNNAALAFSQATIATAAQVASVNVAVRLTDQQKTVVPSPSPVALTLALNATAGTYSGTFRLTDTNPLPPNKPVTRSANYFGVFVPRYSAAGIGAFQLDRLPEPANGPDPATTPTTSPVESGRVELTPAP